MTEKELSEADRDNRLNSHAHRAASDPVEMATLTVRAVDQIGAAAASEIEKAANALEQRASEIAEKLRNLAAAVREHSQLAGASVSEFCEKSTSVIETIRALQERLDRRREQ